MSKLLNLFLCLCAANWALAQCNLDRHNTNWMDGWKSCETAPSPASGVSSHWIMYDLQADYLLGDLHVWNYNDPKDLNSGARKISIQTRTELQNWQFRGSFLLPKATGSSFYQGHDLARLENVEARYILLTLVENYGGDCSGIAELKLDVTPALDLDDEQCFAAKASPNPFEEQITLLVSSEGAGNIAYKLYNAMGQPIENGALNVQAGINQMQLSFPQIGTGLYYLVLHKGDCEEAIPIIKE